MKDSRARGQDIKHRGTQDKGVHWVWSAAEEAQSRLPNMDWVPNVVGQLKAGESPAWFLRLKGALGSGRKGAGWTRGHLPGGYKGAQGRDGLSRCGWVWW